ncbi:AAA family ATPase, partial [Escherichia coli]|nr:AAA family ATPase [Escherichia coli]
MTLPIFLIGPRGCGKTTIGHALARARHYQFTDTDHALQEREQRTVATIVEQEGW